MVGTVWVDLTLQSEISSLCKINIIRVNNTKVGSWQIFLVTYNKFCPFLISEIK